MINEQSLKKYLGITQTKMFISLNSRIKFLTHMQLGLYEIIMEHSKCN